MLDYRNMAAQLYLHDERLTLTEDDVSLCFLPLTHVFERAWSFYVMHTGALNVYLSDTNLVRKAMVSVKPTVMCAVPRFYEKVFSGIYEKVAQAPWYKRALFHWAVRTGKRPLMHSSAVKNSRGWLRGVISSHRKKCSANCVMCSAVMSVSYRRRVRGWMMKLSAFSSPSALTSNTATA